MPAAAATLSRLALSLALAQSSLGSHGGFHGGSGGGSGGQGSSAPREPPALPSPRAPPSPPLPRSPPPEPPSSPPHIPVLCSGDTCEAADIWDVCSAWTAASYPVVRPAGFAPNSYLPIQTAVDFNGPFELELNEGSGNQQLSMKLTLTLQWPDPSMGAAPCRQLLESPYGSGLKDAYRASAAKKKTESFGGYGDTSFGGSGKGGGGGTSAALKWVSYTCSPTN